jgi:hypothetical protein
MFSFLLPVSASTSIIQEFGHTNSQVPAELLAFHPKGLMCPSASVFCMAPACPG